MKIKKCPFCGITPSVFTNYDCRKAVECTCKHCTVNPGTNLYDTEQEAVNAWNIRVSD